MTLAASGTMSLAGTATDRSVQVALGGDGSTQISMNDTAVRALAGEATGPISMTDFHGKSVAGGITARYVRISNFTRSRSAGPFISQFALYTDDNLQNLIIGQNASTNPTIPELSASVSPYSSYSAAKAGSIATNTGWYLGGRSTSLIINDWIQYDMGSPITIGSILVRNGYGSQSNNFYASGFNVEHSNDGTNWTLMQALTGITTGAQTFTINTGPPPPPPVILDVVTVTQGSLIAYTMAYYGFERFRNPDTGSVSPISLTISGTSYDVHSITRRVSRSSGVDNDASSSIYFVVYAAADGSVPTDAWFSSMLVQTSGDPVVLTPATANIHTFTDRKEWRWFYNDFTSAEITALSAKWNGSGTSTVTFMG